MLYLQNEAWYSVELLFFKGEGYLNLGNLFEIEFKWPNYKASLSFLKIKIHYPEMKKKYFKTS